MLKTLPYEGCVFEPHVWVAATTKPGQQGGQGEGGEKESPHDADTAGLSPLLVLPIEYLPHSPAVASGQSRSRV